MFYGLFVIYSLNSHLSDLYQVQKFTLGLEYKIEIWSLLPEAFNYI